MIPNNFPSNPVPPMPNYKEFYQNPMQMSMNPQGQMNPMMQPPAPGNYQMPPQMAAPKMPGSQPNIISSNFIPNKDFNNRKDMFNKGPNPKMMMPRGGPQSYHPSQHQHKIDPMSQRSTKIMKMPGGQGGMMQQQQAPRKMDFFKQSNYRKNNQFGQDINEDMEDQSMKMNKMMRPPPMQMIPKPPMPMRKGKMGMDPMKMRQPFFQSQFMDPGMGPFGGNRMGGYPDQMNEMGEFGFGKGGQKCI